MTDNRLDPRGLRPSATDGQVLKTVAGVTQWADESGGGATTLDQLTDVDTSTTPPADGQGLVFDAASALWVPSDLASGAVPPGGTTGQVLAKASAADYDTAWVDQTGGGGSSVPLAVADALPVTPSAKDDEFNGASGMSGPATGLHAKWSRRNFAAGLQTFGKQLPDSLIFQLAGSDPQDQSIYQTAPVGDFTITSRFEAKRLVSRQMWGIYVVDSSLNGIVLHVDDPGGDSFKLRNMSNLVATTVLTAFPNVYGSQYVAGIPLFLKLAKVGTTYTGTFWMDATSNGSVRSQTASASLAFTPAYIGVGRVGLTGDAYFGVDFFRVS